ncbi:zinc finger protein [Diaporthe amygdali]|uniref:zinc finger protein n=1 Tax=Phomopsis amygdali TaxID=1214568 RepID=UPI0022FDE270|nr:zinc finger protein [Diaporthe amygdali]KAJ0100731.1 zinc finger protein [Diaporthe amygdali]
MEIQVPSTDPIRDGEGFLVKWCYDDRRASDRRKLYNILFRAKSFNDLIPTLNMVWDRDSLALALNDTPETYRIRAFNQLRERNPDAYKELVGKVSSLQRIVYEKELDPTFLYPRVATNSFMATLPPEARQCFDCGKEFDEFSDMIWRPCRKHVGSGNSIVTVSSLQQSDEASHQSLLIIPCRPISLRPRFPPWAFDDQLAFFDCKLRQPHHIIDNDLVWVYLVSFWHQYQESRDCGPPQSSRLARLTGKLLADSDMDKAMSYCYDRGGGQYTRLVPVDMLPIKLKDIPRRVNTDEGMIVLPVPHRPGPDGQLTKLQLESVVIPSTSPNGVSTDNIQSRIDSIINSSPGASSSALALSTRGFDGGTNRSLTTQNHGGAPGGGPRHEKIYCDKWIHDGTCAFTQRGCKYKHEMPHDRETQETLGLFHGYPAWWKKQAVEQQRPLAIDDRLVSVGPGRGGFPTSVSAGVLGSSLSSAVVYSNWRFGAVHAGDSVVQGINSHTAPATDTKISGGLVRSGSIDFGGSSRGNALQPHTPASFHPATYGPIAPPSRVGISGSSGPSSGVPTTRNSRALTTSSMASTDDGPRGCGAPFHRSVLDPSNPCAALGTISSQARVQQEESGSDDGDTATNSGEQGEQRGAPL